MNAPKLKITSLLACLLSASCLSAMAAPSYQVLKSEKPMVDLTKRRPANSFASREASPATVSSADSRGASISGSGGAHISDESASANSEQLVNPEMFQNQPAKATLAGPFVRQLSQALRNFHVVTPLLYRGAQPDLAGLEALKKAGVGTVVSFRNEPDVLAQERQATSQVGLKFVNIPMAIFDPVKQDQVDQFLSIVQNATQPVYCHCQFGQDRTGVMVAMYRMLKEGWSGDQALQEMLGYGFKPQLLNYTNAVVACSKSLGRPASPPSSDYIYDDFKKRLGRILGKRK